MATTFLSNTYAFGAGGGPITDVTLQSRSVTTRMDKKTATGSDGEIIAVAFYGKIAEHKVELLNTAVITDLTCEATGTKPSIIARGLTGTTAYYIVEEITVDMSNEDFVKGSCTISEYDISLK